jgi:shikimate kinase
MRGLFLVGPMGAGKTTIGKRLAELTHTDFWDADHEIEARTGVDIPYIFEKEGEAGFRRREKEVILDLTQQSHIVLATGGGAILDSDNRKALSARGTVVFLHASVEQQLRRTGSSSNRPLLQHANRQQILTELFALREPLYREIADKVVYTDHLSTRQIVEEVREFWQSQSSHL